MAQTHVIIVSYIIQVMFFKKKIYYSVSIMLCLAFIPRGKKRYHISENHRRYLCVYCVLLLDLRPINPLAYAFGYPCSSTAQSHIYIFHPLPPSVHSSVCHCIYIYGSRLMHDSSYTTFALLSVCMNSSSFFLSFSSFVCLYIYLFLIPMSVFRARLT